MALVIAFPPAFVPPPTLGVSGRAVRGAPVVVTGGGYRGRSVIELHWDRGMRVAAVVPDERGTFELRLTIPASTSPGIHDLSAVDPERHFGPRPTPGPETLASTSVTVQTPGSPAQATQASPRPSGSARATPSPVTPLIGGGASVTGGSAPQAKSASPAAAGAAATPASKGASPKPRASPTPAATATPAATRSPAPTRSPSSTPQPTPTPIKPSSGALYVATNGSDANPGTASAPFRTVTKGLRSVRPGQTLYLRGGTYVENVQASPAGTSSARILVSSYPGERAVIKGLVSISNPRFVTFNAFNVTWNTGNYDQHMFKITGGSGWVLQSSEIWGARSFADLLIAGSPHGWAVRYNVIHDTYGGEADVNRSHNIYANTNLDATAGVIERNLIYNATHGTNLKLAGAGGSGGGAANVLVRYNTLYNATQPLLIGDGSHNITATRNIIGKSAKGNVVRLYDLVGGGNSVRDNVLFAGSTACADYGSPIKCSAVMSANLFPHDPRFASGFHPTDAVASNYGRFAP